MKEEISKGVLETLNIRIFSNPVYFTFGLSWILVHWRFFVTMFFVSNESILSQYHLTKDVYLKHLLFDTSHYCISLLVIATPFLVTAFVLYCLQPKILPGLLKKHKEYDDVRIKIEKGKIAEEVVVEKEKKSLLDLKEQNILKEENITKKEWDEDYERFTSSGHYEKFESLVDNLYSGSDKGMWLSNFDARDISYFDALGLIILSPNQVESLTGKGKYFLLKMKIDYSSDYNNAI